MPIDDDDDYWAARMNMSSADYAAIRDQAEQNARDAYDADTRAMAAGDDVADGRADDGGGVDKFATGVQAQMGRLMAQRIAAVDSGDGAGLPLRGMLPPTLPGPVPEPPPGCIVWPLPGHTQINTRKPAIQQGNGDFGWVRTNDDGSPRRHQGLDITAAPGTPVLAAHGGRTSRADSTDPNYGKRIRIEGPAGLATQYAHLSEFGVKPGDPVVAGQLIGWTGTTGNAAKSATKPGGDPHLHFEVIDRGQHVDPRSKLCPPTPPTDNDE